MKFRESTPPVVPTSAFFLNPVLFLIGFSVLGILFGLQDWHESRAFKMHADLGLLLRAWGVQYLLWGLLCLLLWRVLGRWLMRAPMLRVLAVCLPLSALLAVIEEMFWVLLFPRAPLGLPPMPYWSRVRFHLLAEPVADLVIFWATFVLFRAIGYSQQLRENEIKAARMDTQLSMAQMQSLRMQLNPHFLFNTLNAISSLMHTDVAAADCMLEQLSSLLRMTLQRGETQMIPLYEEMEFVGLYMEMQKRRFADRVTQTVQVDPGLMDALVPAMILQPLVENAYKHGIAKTTSRGVLAITIQRKQADVFVQVCNSGSCPPSGSHSSVGGVGLSNVRRRLELHFGNRQSLNVTSVDSVVTVSLQFPFQTASATHEIER